MTYENIQINKPNFCLGPQAGTYCFIDDSNTDWVRMRVRSNTGSPISSYAFYPTNILYTSNRSSESVYNKPVRLAYIGPTDLTDYHDNLQFYTLEREILNGDSDYSEKAIIRRWIIDSDNSYLRLVETFQKSGEFNSYAFAIEKKLTTFYDGTPANTGVIEITTTSGLKKYDSLMLGPSTDADNPGAVEFCYVYSVSGTQVQIKHPDYTPPLWQYADGDDITVRDRAFLFSNVGTVVDPDSGGGRIYELDLNDGATTISGTDSGIYTDVVAARWHETYNTVVFVNKTNMLVLALTDYEITNSMYLNNLRADKQTIISVYDIDFEGTDVYRLQDRTVKRDDNNNLADYSWASFGPYNYQLDTLAPYTSSVEVVVSPERYLIQDQSVTVDVFVKDQFGNSILGKSVWFTKSGDNDSSWQGVHSDGTDVTDSDGRADIIYKAGNTYVGDAANIDVKVDGSSTSILGSQYVWCKDVYLKTRCSVTKSHGSNFLYQYIEPDSSFIINQKSITPTTNIILNQKAGKTGSLPGTLRQEATQVDTVVLKQDIQTDTVQLTQKALASDTLYVDQVYISRHYSTGHKDSVTVDQFTFIQNARPVFWSEKNPIDTDIWLRLAPYAYSLNASTLKIWIKEFSYAGREEWREITGEGTISYWEASGPSLLGLEFEWHGEEPFHYNGLVDVKIEVYDVAPNPNIIITEYWFRLIPDFRKPYLDNLNPGREEYDVPADTGIYFEIKDIGAGIDTDTLEFYVNNRAQIPELTKITKQYYQAYFKPEEPFVYGDEISVVVIVKDESDNANRLTDFYRFYIAESAAPWFDQYHYRPKRCRPGMPRDYSDISFQVYDGGNGVDPNGIIVYVGQQLRDHIIEPIVYREG